MLAFQICLQYPKPFGRNVLWAKASSLVRVVSRSSFLALLLLAFVVRKQVSPYGFKLMFPYTLNSTLCRIGDPTREPQRVLSIPPASYVLPKSPP